MYIRPLSRVRWAAGRAPHVLKDADARTDGLRKWLVRTAAAPMRHRKKPRELTTAIIASVCFLGAGSLASETEGANCFRPWRTSISLGRLGFDTVGQNERHYTSSL